MCSITEKYRPNDGAKLSIFFSFKFFKAKLVGLDGKHSNSANLECFFQSLPNLVQQPAAKLNYDATEAECEVWEQSDTNKKEFRQL